MAFPEVMAKNTVVILTVKRFVSMLAPKTGERKQLASKIFYSVALHNAAESGYRWNNMAQESLPKCGFILTNLEGLKHSHNLK